MSIELFEFVGEHPWRFVVASACTIGGWCFFQLMDQREMETSLAEESDEDEKQNLNRKIVEARLAIVATLGVVVFALFILSQAIAVLLYTEGVTIGQAVENLKHILAREPLWQVAIIAAIWLFFVVYVSGIILVGMMIVGAVMGAVVFGVALLVSGAARSGATASKVFRTAFQRRK